MLHVWANEDFGKFACFFKMISLKIVMLFTWVQVLQPCQELLPTYSLQQIDCYQNWNNKKTLGTHLEKPN